MKTLHFHISGMHCDACVASIRDAIDNVVGVTATDVTLDAADVTFDQSACGVAEVLAAVRGAGPFDVTAFSTKDG